LTALSADVRKESSITAAVDKILEESGALHGMVVNAGRTNHKSALDFSSEEIEELFAVNVSFLCFLLRGVSCHSTAFYMIDDDYVSVHSFSAPSTPPVLQQGPSSSSASRAQSSSPHQWLRTALTKSCHPLPTERRKAACGI
jgi:NAD(P)-dependent dehydrogenase (short-subunit alcohol dehydrogenase family)